LWLIASIINFISFKARNRGAWSNLKNLFCSARFRLGNLSEEQLNVLSTAYDELADKPLLTFPEMAEDPVRARIDEAIVKALGLPDFSILRRLLAQEPVVCLKRL
jgi:hypothetical protein